MRKVLCFILFLALAVKLPGQVLNQETDIRQSGGRYYDAAGNEYIYIDARMIRGVIGYSSGNLSFNTGKPSVTIPNRTWWSVYLRNEFRIISSYIDRHNKFVVRDAMYLDLGLGKMTSTPLKYNDGNPEGLFTVNSSFGYQLLAGYRNKTWALLCGANALWAVTFTGSAFDPNKLLRNYIPFVLRGEYRPWGGNECRIVACAFSNFNSSNAYYGAFLDLPISKRKRFFLTAQYLCRNTYMTVTNYYTYPSVISQWMIGFKVGSIY